MVAIRKLQMAQQNYMGKMAQCSFYPNFLILKALRVGYEGILYISGIVTFLVPTLTYPQPWVIKRIKHTQMNFLWGVCVVSVFRCIFYQMGVF